MKVFVFVRGDCSITAKELRKKTSSTLHHKYNDTNKTG